MVCQSTLALGNVQRLLGGSDPAEFSWVTLPIGRFAYAVHSFRSWGFGLECGSKLGPEVASGIVKTGLGPRNMS